MKFTKNIKGSALIITVEVDSLDLGNSVGFREGLAKEVEGATSDLVVLDMSKVNYIDSSSLGVLITFLKFNKDAGRGLRLASCNKKVEDTMQSTKLVDEIPIYNTVEEAIK
jgi:anti-sigma B factor antagonist